MGTSKLKDIIDKVDFIAITQALNIKTYPNGTGHTFKTKCPAKCSPDDNQGLIDNKTGLYHCNWCDSKGGKEEFLKLLKDYDDQDAFEFIKKYLNSQAKPYEIKDITKHEITIQIENRIYEITGARLKTLKDFTFKLKLCAGSQFVFSEVNLSRPKSRFDFITEAKDTLFVSEESIKDDMYILMEAIEKLQRENLQRIDEEREALTKKYILTPDMESKAKDYLSNRDIINEDLLIDTENIGYVGDTIGKKVLYICCTSRLLKTPLSVISIANSSAGKSFAQETISSLMPDDEYYYFTRMSPKSLSHFKKYALRNKLIVLDELGGAEEESMYYFRSFLSKGMLTAGYTSIDRQTGEMETMAKEIYGPVAFMTSTTHEELMDDETRNRLVILTVDESSAQTLRVLRSMMKSSTKKGAKLLTDKNVILEKYKSIQKVLEPMKVIFPDSWEDKIQFDTTKVSNKRKYRNYISIIETIALHRQYQKKIHEVQDSHGRKHNAIYADKRDVDDANILSREIFKHSVRELNPVNYKCFEDIKTYCQERAKETSLPIEETFFTRKDIRLAAYWEQRPLRRAFENLEDMEYIFREYGADRGRHFYKVNMDMVRRKETEIQLWNI